MKIANLLLLLAAPFNRIFGGGNVGQTSFLPASNTDSENPLDLHHISSSEEKNAATSWLGNAYSMLKFPEILPGAEALMVGNRDFKTTVYCGPRINCDYLNFLAEKKKIELVKDGRIKNKKGVERLVIEAHGEKGSTQLMSPESLVQPDDFAAEFFPNVKIIHVISCFAGENPQQNFKENSLKPGQILFLHAGDEVTAEGINHQASSFLVLEQNSQFPSPLPLHILFKDPESLTIFAELAPVTLRDISLVVGEENTKEQKIDSLYDLIAGHINAQKESALEKFADNPQARDIMTAELEKLGFVDFTQEKYSAKKEFVQDYLGRHLISLANWENPSSVKAELGYIEEIVRSGLVDVNYRLHDNQTAVLISSTNGHDKLLELLVKNGADVNIARLDGATAALGAVAKNREKCLEILATSNGDLDKSRDHDGATPAILAAYFANTGCLKILIKNGVNLNKPDIAGATPLMILVNNHCQGSNDYKKLITLMIEKGANPELKPGRAPNAYEVAQQDRSLLQEMKKTWGEFLIKPDSTLGKAKAYNLKTGVEKNEQIEL